MLDYLRKKENLTGTKEGCREGECGACMVLVGALNGEEVHYRPANSCLLPLGELQGKHLVTIEGINTENLSPVQQAIVDEGATQCGFCTPGIIISLTGYLMQEGVEISNEGIKKALSGNLCRCTGYASLKRAGNCIVNSAGKLINSAKYPAKGNRIETLIANKILPEYFREIPSRLRNLPQPVPEDDREICDFIIAGGTDIYIQKGDTIPDRRVKLLNLYPEMKGITKKNGHFHLGALTSFEEFASHPEIIGIFPDIQQYMPFVASWPIRNRATLGGNIVNASPIGDITILLLALDALLVLKDKETLRTVPMREFFKGYKKLNKNPSEILMEIILDVPPPATRIHFEKVSKRKYQDVASVNCGVKVRCEDGIVREIGLAMGGVAPIPLFLKKTCAYFLGKRLSKETIEGAFPIVQTEITPMSDIRGSTDYKRLLACQLLIVSFTKLFPEFVTADIFYETY